MAVKQPNNPAPKAIGYIESHLAGDIMLGEVARVAGVSRFHTSLAFAYGTGRSISRYIRGRRLTEAARLLARGAPDILTVALSVGYGSHEAFTRAFRDEFSITPEMLRTAASIESLQLTEPVRMKETLLENVAPPRFVDGPTMLIANLGERYTSGTSARIPEQWQRLGPYIGHIQGQIGNTAYGVLCNGDDAGKEYIAGVEVADSPRIPQEFSRIRIPEQRYTVFHHAGHISTQFGANGFRSPDVSRPAVPSLNGTVLSLTQ